MFRLLKNNIGAASFPAAKKTFTDLIDGTTIMEAVNANTAYDEIEALQTFLGALGAGNTQSYACALLDVIQGLRIGARVTYTGAAELSVAVGRIVFESSGKYRLRENTSATSVDWSNIDTGAEANDTYYVLAVADAEATTFTIMVSLSPTAPTGATYFKLLGEFENVAGDIVEGSVIDYDSPAYGAYVTKANNTEYAALTDGIVIAFDDDESTGAEVRGFCDSSSPPTTLRAVMKLGGAVGDSFSCTITFPVQKGENWKVTGATGTVFWMAKGGVE